MKKILTALLFITVISANAQARHDSSYHQYLHYPFEREHIVGLYEYSHIEFSQNPHAMIVNTKFNIQTCDSLQSIIEDIKGIEHIDTWQVHKYDFLVIVGDMFDPYKVGDIIQRRIEYFAKSHAL